MTTSTSRPSSSSSSVELAGQSEQWARALADSSRASSAVWAVQLPGGAQLRSGSRWSGDFSGQPVRGAWPGQERLAPLPWTWLVQVHGSGVVVVEAPGARQGARGDAAVTTAAGAVLAVRTADCAPVALSSREGAIGVVHAGWRGVMRGVIAEAVDALRRLGATEVFAAIGPCVHPHAYRFAEVDLAEVEGAFGAGVRAVDSEGYPAVDLPALVGSALARAGASLVAASAVCTHCSPDHWSWRARRDSGRQATVVWLPPAANEPTPRTAP